MEVSPIEPFTITVPVAGADGSAVGSNTSTLSVNGRITAVHVAYTTQPATCDVVLKTKNSPTKTILTLTDANTSGWFYPRHTVHDPAGAVVTFDGTNELYEMFPVADTLEVTVAQGNAGSVVVTVEVERS